MIKKTYFAVCPMPDLILELRRLKLDDQGIEGALFSENESSRLRKPVSERIAKVKCWFLTLFNEYLNDQQIDAGPFVNNFERYWHIHIFDYCDDIDESIADRVGKPISPLKNPEPFSS